MLCYCQVDVGDGVFETPAFQTTSNVDGSSGGGLSAVPVPRAVWLFSSALMGLVGVKRRD